MEKQAGVKLPKICFQLFGKYFERSTVQMPFISFILSSLNSFLRAVTEMTATGVAQQNVNLLT